MNVSEERIRAGQAIYTRRNLRLYDFIVHSVSNHLVWNCPTQRLVEHYNKHVTANHLDVGVGTGYFLDHCRFPSHTPRIALADVNRNSLDFAARRIARHTPETYLRNVLEPVSIDAAKTTPSSAKFRTSHLNHPCGHNHRHPARVRQRLVPTQLVGVPAVRCPPIQNYDQYRL